MAEPDDDNTLIKPEAAARDKHVAAKDPLIGAKLENRYRIISFIGGGGMSVVYQAKDDVLNKVVAVKLLLPHLAANPLHAQRFLIEARAAFGMSHPNVISIYNFGSTDNGRPYIVMDYLEGVSLDECIAVSRRLPVDRSVRIFIQICEALAAAHERGILHRDLKPSNIMLLTVANRDFVKIVDFGIAKLLTAEGEASLHLTKTGEIFGSPLYMSPEQCRGEELDARSDIYSLGCLMYETLTGKPPLAGRNLMETFHKQLHEVADDFRTLDKTLRIPQKLEAIVFRALSKDPQKRYQSMEEIKADLESVQHQQDLDPISRLLLQFKLLKFKARPIQKGERRWILIAASAFVLLAASALVLLNWSSDVTLPSPGADPHWVVVAPKRNLSDEFSLAKLVMLKDLNARRANELHGPAYKEELKIYAKKCLENGYANEAVPCYRELYELSKAEDGPFADYTMVYLILWADALDEEGQYAEAVEHYATALEHITTRSSFELNVPQIEVKMGDAYYVMKNYQDALRYYMRGLNNLADRRHNMKTDAHKVAQIEARMGDCARLLGINKSAVTYYELSRNSWNESNEPSHANVIMCTYYIGCCYLAQGLYGQALKNFREVFNDKEADEALSVSQASRLLAVRQYRDLLFRQGDYVAWIKQAILASELQSKLRNK